MLGALLIEQYHESIKQRSKSKNKGKRGAEVRLCCYLRDLLDVSVIRVKLMMF